MIRSKYTGPVCALIVAAALIFTILFSFTDLLGIQAANAQMGYEALLFDDTQVHTIDIVADEGDWADMIANAAAEEYISCTVVIDGEEVGNAAIRAKGNTSLSSVQGMNSQRYSFKVEFDHYVSGGTYHGLDKLSLNNLIYDATYMKDYLVYDMMRYIGAKAPLSSFAAITVNGEAWGLYLAVEAVEDAFLTRNYGRDHGELYKPDSMSMQGGGQKRGDMPEQGTLPEGFTPATPGNAAERAWGGNGGRPALPENFDLSNMEGGAPLSMAGGFSPGQGGGRGNMGSSDVALQYTDDDPESYANIFGSAKTDVSSADKARLIASLKQLAAGEDLEAIVDVEEVLRYFAAHNFAVSFDSYTGSLMHNYYLYEEDGRLSMVAWDYNLAFGTFSGGGGGGESSARQAVNYPIDTPVSGTTLEDRPMLGQLLADETYLARYHEILDELVSGYFESRHFDALMDRMTALLSPYVESDASAFYTHDEFLQGSEALRTFCTLRAESIRGQLDGTIPATEEGQAADNSGLIETGNLTLSDMGVMSMGRGGAAGKKEGE